MKHKKILVAILLTFATFLSFGIKTHAMETYQIEYTITSASTVISTDLTQTDVDYIILHNNEITGHDDIILATTVVESYVSNEDSGTPATATVTFTTAVLTYTSTTHEVTSSVNLKEGSQTVRIYFQISSGVINDFGQTLGGWLAVILGLLLGSFSGVVPVFWASATGFTVYGYLMLFGLVIGFVGLALGFIYKLIQK